ncbi:hypothetical protein lerEdw1_010624 [Lerista edwardsae]|nr:hypothetical protein lerEdw1_010624 [Lerista edwardsae]
MFTRRKTPGPPPACPNVLTPDRIPRFLIPPSLATMQGRRAGQSPGAPSAAVHGEATAREEGRAAGRLYAAASMPQLSTPAGLAFLPESPHTRRRESLFHGERLPRRSPHAWRPSPAARPPPHLDSDTASSTETSPYGSPLPLRSPGAGQATYGPRRKFAGRPADVRTLPRPSSLSAEETSSADTSPSVLRREPEPSWGPLATLRLFPLDLIRCHERLTKEVTLTVSSGGRLRLSTEYLEPQGRLRVRLVSAEAFYPPHCDPRHVSCCVSLRLRPGAGPRQRSATVKLSRNPIFNEDFFFEGVLPADLPRHSLRLKVLNRGSAMRRDTVLGECDVPLDALLPP